MSDQRWSWKFKDGNVTMWCRITAIVHLNRWTDEHGARRNGHQKGKTEETRRKPDSSVTSSNTYFNNIRLFTFWFTLIIFYDRTYIIFWFASCYLHVSSILQRLNNEVCFIFNLPKYARLGLNLLWPFKFSVFLISLKSTLLSSTVSFTHM
jgi:hypothetical protein